MKIKKFQNGGPVAPEAAPADPSMAPAPEQGGDPLTAIAQMFAEGLQSGNCELLAQGAEAFLQVISQAQPAPAEQPVFKRGGKLARK